MNPGPRKLSYDFRDRLLSAITLDSFLRNWKFESISLQQTVRLSPDFTRLSEKAPVFRHFGGGAGRQGRERHRGAKQHAKRSASVSVGRYSSTAVLLERLATLAALTTSELRLATSVEV